MGEANWRKRQDANWAKPVFAGPVIEASKLIKDGLEASAKVMKYIEVERKLALERIKR